MIVAKIEKGLGNQLFMYANARAYALSNKTSLALEISYFLSKNRVKFGPQKEKFWINKYNINFDKLIFDNYIKNRRHLEDIIPFVREHTNPPKLNHVFLNGYWQKEIYFKDIKEKLLKELTLKKPITDVNLNKIHSYSNSVSVTVRRGDFLNLKDRPVLNENYYCEAANLILKTEKDCHFFLFSDDDQWVEKVLMNKSPFANRCTQIKRKICYHDLELSKSCKHHIVANSTFSWWSAWLSPDENKIIINPKYWDNAKRSIAPPDWITLENYVNII
jgi:hypothetical protein